MNRVTREPDEFPELPDELLELAKELGWIVAFFVCETEESDSISFAAAVPTVPEIDSLIKLQNGALCRVDNVMYVLSLENGLMKMTPNVHAVLESLPSDARS
jgi:hypothetical protein